MSKGPLVIRIAHGRTSYERHFYPYPAALPPSFQERHENVLSLILFHGMRNDVFAFFSLASIIVQLGGALNSLYCIPTLGNQSIIYFV